MNKIFIPLLWFGIRTILTVVAISIVNMLLRRYNNYVITLIDLALVYIFELLDSLPVQILSGREYTGTELYNNGDKIVDIFLYFYVLVNHLQRVGKIGVFEIVFILVSFYRLIGVLIFIATGWKWSMVIFPNLFDSIMVYLLLKYVFKASKPVVFILTFISVPLKISYEYWHHVIYNPRICNSNKCE